MLILNARAGERIIINDNVVIEVLEPVKNFDKPKTRLGFTAPADCKIYREKIYKQIQEEQGVRYENQLQYE